MGRNDAEDWNATLRDAAGGTRPSRRERELEARRDAAAATVRDLAQRERDESAANGSDPPEDPGTWHPYADALTRHLDAADEGSEGD